MIIYNITIDLGELCSPFRYSYPPGCINSVILNTNDANVQNNKSNEEDTRQMSEEELNEPSSNDTNNSMNIDVGNLTMPLCIYR